MSPLEFKNRSNKSRRILLICNECITSNMTGPAIRYWEFARNLGQYFTVTLAIPPHVSCQDLMNDNLCLFEIVKCCSQAELKTLVNQTDVIITVGINLSLYPFLAKTIKPLVVDMYIPFMLEDLQKHQEKSISQQIAFFEGTRGAHSLQIRVADFLICASEKQKDFWLGWLAALGRINPYLHNNDPTLKKLIAVVPFGLPSKNPVHDTPVMKGVYKSIGLNDKVILWGGGIWSWFDPLTLIKVMVTLVNTHPHIKLFFMGTKSPNSSTAQMNTASQAIELSRNLELFEKTIFFNDWVPYHQRHNYLLEADIGVTLHRNHIETRFAFRTRLLDYIWTGLPILATEGDIFSEEIRRGHLGKVVPSGDVEAVKRGLFELLETPNLRQHYQPHFAAIQEKYRWETVMQPLLAFCEKPYRAVDKPHLGQIPLAESGVSASYLLPAKIWRTLRFQGVSALIKQTAAYFRWRWQK